jgi:hypothetical protein
MEYVTWKLNWPTSKYGTGPEQAAFDAGARLEASSWVNPTVEEGTILGYLTGELDLSVLSEWNVVNITPQQALDFALALDENAFVMDDGVISTTGNMYG